MQVRVRMYRQGLGDCYLLTFGDGAAEKHVLIDCGTLGSTTNPLNSMKSIVEHIRDTTGGHLHLLVATHEHKDHLSGFSSLKKIFTDEMTIDRIWVAWTENPMDQDAKNLKKYDNDLGQAAAAGVTAMRAAAKAAPKGNELEKNAAEALKTRANQAEAVLEFFGDDVLAAGKFAPTIHEAMELVRGGFGKKEAEYLLPQTLKPVDDWLPEFRVYVLGPPKSTTAIGDTGEEGGGDQYPYPAAGILAAAAAIGSKPVAEGEEDPERELIERQLPFDQCFQIPDPAKLGFYKGYEAKDDAWRRVDHDWMSFSSILALQLDNRTNNTSLVLAFERIADGKVLLFPADAQRGNWQSWTTPNELQWTVPAAGGGQTTVKTGDLLKRTVFYKVGHHSSHNATAKENGLEKMEDNALVAFIPLDRQVALNKNWNTMPTRALYQRLMEKCNGRVARSDVGWVTPDIDPEFKSMFTDAQWAGYTAVQQALETSGAVKFEKLFVDYILA